MADIQGIQEHWQSADAVDATAGTLEIPVLWQSHRDADEDFHGKYYASFKIRYQKLDSSKSVPAGAANGTIFAKAYTTGRDMFQGIDLVSASVISASNSGSDIASLPTKEPARSGTFSDVHTAAMDTEQRQQEEEEEEEEEEDLSSRMANMSIGFADELLMGVGSHHGLNLAMDWSIETLIRDLPELAKEPPLQQNISLIALVWGRVSDIDLASLLEDIVVAAGGHSSATSHQRSAPAAGHGCTQGSNNLKAPAKKRKRGAPAVDGDDSKSNSTRRSRIDRYLKCSVDLWSGLFNCPLSLPVAPTPRCHDRTLYSLDELKEVSRISVDNKYTPLTTVQHVTGSHSDLMPGTAWTAINHSGRHFSNVQVYYRIKTKLLAASRGRQMADSGEVNTCDIQPGSATDTEIDAAYHAFVTQYAITPIMQEHMAMQDRLVQRLFRAAEGTPHDSSKEAETGNLKHSRSSIELAGPASYRKSSASLRAIAPRPNSFISNQDSGYGTRSIGNATAPRIRAEEVWSTPAEPLNPGIVCEASVLQSTVQEPACVPNQHLQNFHESQLVLPQWPALPVREYYQQCIDPSFLQLHSQHHSQPTQDSVPYAGHNDSVQSNYVASQPINTQQFGSSCSLALPSWPPSPSQQLFQEYINPSP